LHCARAGERPKSAVIFPRRFATNFVYSVMRSPALVFALMLCSAVAALGYMVGPPVGLEDLANQSDIIFQGTVESDTTVQDASFQSCPGFMVQETIFKGVWTLKSETNVLPQGYRRSQPMGGTLKFRHYTPDPNGQGFMYEPQSYLLEPGKTYMVFAKQPPGSDPATCRQIWMSHTGMMDEGVLLCAHGSHLANGKINGVIWASLTRMLKSTDLAEIVYAINHLDLFSGSAETRSAFDSLCEFQRKDVLAEVHGFLTNANTSVAQAAVEVVGSHNPYMERERAQAWLATVGDGTNKDYGPMDPHFVNEGGLIYWRELEALVDSKADDNTRAAAVRALGLVREESLQGNIQRWLGDKSAAVRSSAVLLLADFPALVSHDRMTSLAADPDAETRISAAYVIGFAQNVDNLGVLLKLMTDSDDKVRQAASQSLMSFSPKDPRVQKDYRDNLANPELRPLAIVALGQMDPAANLDLLIEETTTKKDPDNWSGGQIPAYTTSHILFDFLVKQPAADLQSGKYDKALDALEIWQPNYAVDPQFVYALELKDGLTERAKKYRVAAAKAAPYDAIFLDRADKDPQQYLY
jgi:hypothetical protein